jgi:hypothetical protein
MSEELKSVTIYTTFVEAIDGVCKNDAEKGKMYTAIVRYALFGEEPNLNSVLLAVFSLMKPAIDKSKIRKINGAKRKQNGSKTEAKEEQDNSDDEICLNKSEKQKGSDIYLNDTSTSSSSSSSNSFCPAFSYPESVEDVLTAAEKAGCVISREEAERYFVCRMSADWVDAAGRKIAPSRLGYDLKKWVLNAEKAENAKKQREVKYEPEW